MHGPQVPVTSRTAYRPDIDGLRAVAVLAVLAFHYGAPIPGGFTGVDVFFVISGFLITSKLRDDIVAGMFSVLGFYDRRMRRILPALLTMLAITLLAGRFLLMPGDYKAVADSSATAAFGVSNFFFLDNTGYFDQASNLMPLLHTWSLAVEEQFYVAWPLLLFVIARGRSRPDTAALLAGTVILGFAVSLLWFDADPKAAFYMAAPRAWELAVGAVLVFLPPLPRIIGETAIASGLALVGAGFLLISASSFPGVAALSPCAGAALVIWPRLERARIASLLGHLSPIGLISYSLYLWHWPVWVLFRIYINNGMPGIRETLALAALSIVLAALSYRFIEQPFRKRRWPPMQTVWTGLAGCTLIFCCAAYVDSADGLPGRISQESYKMRSLAAMWEWPCRGSQNFENLPELCTFGAQWSAGVDKAVLWGDSNAEQLPPLLDDAAKEAKVSITLLPTCPAILDGKTARTRNEWLPDYNKHCGETRAEMLSVLSRRADIKLVILAASWSTLMPGLTGEDVDKLFEASLRDTVSRILATGKKVVLIATIPQWSHDPTACELLNIGLLRRQCGDADRFLPRSAINNFQIESLKVLRRVAAEYPAIHLIIPTDRLCSTDKCVTRVNGEPIYRDSLHFRRNLSETTNRDLARLIGLDQIFH
jgi:peptidoglycan/LPS O-acetylase OafA/YrhL